MARPLTLAALLLGLAPAAFAQDDPLEPAFRLVREAVERGDVPGALALVARRDRVLREEAYGVCDPDRKTPFAKNTLCFIASITKPVAAAAAMTLVDRGKIAMDDPVEKHLPEFKEQKDREGAHHAFTVRHLLTHASGLQREPPTRKATMGADWLTQDLAAAVRAIPATELQFAPGTRFQYSNAGFCVLARVLEVASGKPFAEYVRDAVLVPLGMRETCFVSQLPAAEAARVSPAWQEKSGRRFCYYRFDPEVKAVNPSPSGGLFSYPGELVRFVRMFVENDGRVVSREGVAEMLKVQRPGRGLGWAVADDGVFSHGGSSGTFAWGDPGTGVVGILFFQFTDDRETVPRLQAAFRKAVRAALEEK
jgi:CubicO group peptidase (beta-lactamase class C family)